MSDRLPPLALAAELDRIIGIDGEDWTNEEFDTVEAAAATIRDLNDLCKLLELRRHSLNPNLDGEIAALKARLKYGE